MVGSVGGGRAGNIARHGAIRRTRSAENLSQTGRTQTRGAQGIRQLRQAGTPSPAGSAPRLADTKARASSTSALDKLEALEKQGEPSLAQAKEMQPFANASNFLYSNFTGDIPSGWTHLQPSSQSTEMLTNLIPDLHINENGILTTPDGLVAALFQTDTGSICVAFGGTTSGEATGQLMERSSGNFGSTVKQWMANAKNALGGTPAIYKKASTLVNALATSNTLSYSKLNINPSPDNTAPSDLAEDLQFQTPPKLVLTGHSLGGGLSQYAALTLGTEDNPVECFGFCSAELGGNIQKEIQEKTAGNQDALNALTSKIKHLKIKGDIVPNMHKLFNVTNYGSSFTIEPTESVVQSDMANKTLDYHVNFLNHFNMFLSTKENEP